MIPKYGSKNNLNPRTCKATFSPDAQIKALYFFNIIILINSSIGSYKETTLTYKYINEFNSMLHGTNTVTRMYTMNK